MTMDEFAVSCDIRLYQSNTTYHFCNVLLKSLLASVFIFTIVFCCFGLLLVLEQGVPAFEDTEEGLLNHDPDLPDHVLLEGHEKQEDFHRQIENWRRRRHLRKKLAFVAQRHHRTAGCTFSLRKSPRNIWEWRHEGLSLIRRRGFLMAKLARALISPAS